LAGLHEDREKLAEMSRAALERYAAHPTWEQSMGKAVDFLIARLNPVELIPSI
jgi:hypothetical protein